MCSGNDCRHHPDKRTAHDPRSQDADDSRIDNRPAGPGPGISRYDADRSEDNGKCHLLDGRIIFSAEQLPDRRHICEKCRKKHQKSDI